MNHTLLATTALLTVIFTPSATLAQEDAETEGVAPSAENRARALFEAGREAYARGEYEVALANWTRAYELQPLPELLYNIGTSLDRLRRDDEALETLEQFLATAGPSDPNREAVERRVAILRRVVSRSETATETSASPEDVPAPEPDTPSEHLNGSAATPLWIASGATAALSLASGVVAVVLWTKADSEYAALEEECRRGCTRQRIDDSSVGKYDTLTTAFLVGAIASGAVAVTLGGLAWSAGTEETVRLSVGSGWLDVRGTW